MIRFCLGKRDEVAAVPSAGPEESGCASDLSCGSCRGEAAPAREGEALTRKIAGEPERGRGMREMEVTAAGLKQENGDQT